MAVKLAGSGAGTVRVAPNSVAAIDARSDRVVGAAPVGTRPGAIAFGSGSLWVANLDDQTISRVDPGTLQTLQDDSRFAEPPTGSRGERRRRLGGRAECQSARQASVLRQPRSTRSSTRVGVDGARSATSCRAGPVRVAAQGDIGVGRAVRRPADAAGRSDRARVGQQLDPNASPTAIAVGDGAEWLTDSEADNVIRVDPTGLVTPIAVGNGPTAIAVGDGGVWVADSLDDAVVRIDPGTRAVTTTIPVGRSPAGVAVGAGSVWVANSGDGTVTRIDPRTDKVARRSRSAAARRRSRSRTGASG